ncbi:hypothetical protein [Alicyclobacillus sendaiensis]|uniref:hypothetical protein n=1 Tax=Alicyclobacillus sendaiensis TaxID=192387 RepID=UPI000ACEB420|nr:hypothetical protein [Alicyclobacillus sendaiensis]
MKLQFGYVVPMAVWIRPFVHPAFAFSPGWHPWHLDVGEPLEWCAIPLALGWHALPTSLRMERAL